MGGNQSRPRQYHPTTDWHGGFASWRRGPLFGRQPQQQQHRSMVPHHTILRQLPTMTLERNAVDLLAMEDEPFEEDAYLYDNEEEEEDNDDSMLYPTTKTKARYYAQYHQHQQQQHALENVTCGECLICMASYQTGDTLVSLSCGHSYHKDCLQEWFVRQCVCPYCRHDVEHEYTIAKKVQAFQDDDDDKWEHASSTRPFWLFWGNHHPPPHHIMHPTTRFFQHGSSSSSRRSYYDRHGSAHVLSPYSSHSSSSHTLVNVLQRRQDVWKHAEHQRTVLEQLSFSTSLSSSSSCGAGSTTARPAVTTTRMRGSGGVVV